MLRSRRVEVRGPDLRRWRIGRTWVAWHPRMRRVRLDVRSGINLVSVLDDVSAGVAAAVLALFVAVLTGPFAGVGVFFAEWMIALLVVPITVGYRVLFHRPWLLYAESADGHYAFVASVVGWAACDRAIAAAVEQIKRSGYPPGNWYRTS